MAIVLSPGPSLKGRGVLIFSIYYFFIIIKPLKIPQTVPLLRRG
jgi:hypothetical protein